MPLGLPTIFFSTLIIIAAYLPLFAFQRVEARADSEYRPSITPSLVVVESVRDLSCGDSVRHRETFSSDLVPLGRTTYVAARVHKLG